MLSDYYFERFLIGLKANFNPAQPRDQLGRWVIGGGNAPVFRGGGGPQSDGHHFVPQSVYKNMGFTPEVRRVLNAQKTGPLRAGPHIWSKEHAQYNTAVREMTHRFLDRNSIRPNQMTADQARSLADDVRRSTDPRIRDFNLRIYRQEILYAIRRRGRGGEQ